MLEGFEQFCQDLEEVKRTRDRAELLRDQLQGEYHRLCEEDQSLGEKQRRNPRRAQGREAMRKAITAATRAVESIDQALREIGRADIEFP